VRPLALAAACFLFDLAGTAATAAEIPSEQRRSGYELMARETRAIQDDDATNPGMLWVLDGEALWNRKPGPAGRACADCHGDARASMKGVAARHPAFDPARGRPVNLEQRINACREGFRSSWRSTRVPGRFWRRAGKPSIAARASSTSPAPCATTTTGGSTSRAA
jgi:sulfur-oxidizing protein SoxA